MFAHIEKEFRYRLENHNVPRDSGDVIVTQMGYAHKKMRILTHGLNYTAKEAAAAFHARNLIVNANNVPPSSFFVTIAFIIAFLLPLGPTLQTIRCYLAPVFVLLLNAHTFHFVYCLIIASVKDEDKSKCQSEIST